MSISFHLCFIHAIHEFGPGKKIAFTSLRSLERRKAAGIERRKEDKNEL